VNKLKANQSSIQKRVKFLTEETHSYSNIFLNPQFSTKLQDQ